MDVIHRFLERACNYRRDLNSSAVLLALRDVDLREGRHVGPFPRGGPLASFQGNIPDPMNDTCEDLSLEFVYSRQQDNNRYQSTTAMVIDYD